MVVRFLSLFCDRGIVYHFHGLVVFSTAVLGEHLVGVVSFYGCLLRCALDHLGVQQITLVIQIQRGADSP
jgi:hypothetical protein